MRIQLNNPKFKYYIGDVRDYYSLESALDGADYVFHAAALKQVPSCEFYPIQAVQTNITGAENVLEAAFQQNIKNVVVKYFNWEGLNVEKTFLNLNHYFEL